jgi:hypothetical protein
VLNIGLDFDGVICEWRDIPKKERTLENYDKIPLMKEAEDIREIWDVGNDLTIITARHYPNARNHVYDWLDRELPNILTHTGDGECVDVIAGVPTIDKWRVLQAIGVDIYIDDNTRAIYCLPKSITPILFRGTHNAHLPWDGLEVNNWPELVTMIKFLKEKLKK